MEAVICRGFNYIHTWGKKEHFASYKLSCGAMHTCLWLIAKGQVQWGVPWGILQVLWAASHSWLSGKSCFRLVTLVTEVEGINPFSLRWQMFTEFLWCTSFCEVLGMREKCSLLSGAHSEELRGNIEANQCKSAWEVRAIKEVLLGNRGRCGQHDFGEL